MKGDARGFVAFGGTALRSLLYGSCLDGGSSPFDGSRHLDLECAQVAPGDNGHSSLLLFISVMSLRAFFIMDLRVRLRWRRSWTDELDNGVEEGNYTTLSEVGRHYSYDDHALIDVE